MSKYRQVISIGIQNTLVYRANFFFRAAFGLVPLLATLYLWRTVYASNPDRPTVAGYTLAGMTSYYLVLTIVDALTAVAEDDWQIAADIRDGRISQFLLKPIDYLAYRLCLFGAGRLVYTMAALLPVGVFILVQREYLTAPPDAWRGLLFGVSVVLTGLLQFLISYTMALLAFWILEISTFIFILFALEYLAGGHLFPLDLLPSGFVQVLAFTPFPYQMYFPVSIYLGRTTGPDLWQGLAIQAFWVAAAYALARWIWSRGIRRYAAVGG
jgi:ABC-2 type transport system permease protein